VRQLTDEQKDTYAYIAGYYTDHGYSPAYREIAIKFNITPRAAQYRVNQIVQKGWLKINPYKKFRNIIVL
jgi:SOS-response transcriptional repressor LexA